MWTQEVDIGKGDTTYGGGEREAGSSSEKQKTEEEKGKSRIRKIPKVHRKKKKKPPSSPNCSAPAFETGSSVFQVSFKLGSTSDLELWILPPPPKYWG